MSDEERIIREVVSELPSCDWCGKNMNEVKGKAMLTSAYTGKHICEVCSCTSSMIYMRRDEIEREALESAKKFRAEGVKVDDDGNCTCPNCTFNRMMISDPEIKRIDKMADDYAKMGKIPEPDTTTRH